MLSIVYSITLFTVLSPCMSNAQGTESAACPVLCSCLGQFIDCSSKLESNLPYNLPSWVTILDISNNALSAANVSEQLSQLTEMIELKLNLNGLTAIPISNTLHNLTTLKASHNKLNESSFVVLKYLPGLRELDLNSNQVSQLTVGLLPNSTTLRILNLNVNKITNIEKGALDPISRLIDLRLAKNLMRHLNKDVFRNLSSLKSLDLSRNRFSKVEGLSFKGLRALTTLKLKSNSIQKLEDGAFFELEALLSLHLDMNSISEVTDGWLYGLSSLQQMSLSHNKIHTLDTVWQFCSHLRDLDLSYNLLGSIEKDTFQQLSKLTTLKLDHNQISFIAEGAFNHTPSLIQLDMNGNKISWTIEDMQGPFIGLKQLTKLGLAGNLITSVSEQALMGLDSLTYLDLSGNQIKTIHANTLNHVPLLQDLIVNSTSLVCDCGLAWLPLFLSNSRIHATNMYCAYPLELSGELLSAVAYQKFLCSPDDFPKPRITEEPQTQVALSGSDAVLTCKAISSSDSPMSFKWRRNNRDLVEPVLHSISQSHNWTAAEGDVGVTHVSQLRLNNVTLDVSALYQCIVSNDFGTVYSHKANLSVYTFPQLLKTPSNVTTKAGSMARLECAASGHPPPQIGWQKDGGTDFPAAQERRVHVMPTDDVFFIVNVKPVDSGVYSCIAKNIAGSIVANATLTVVEPPSFVKAMENKEVKVGEAIVLECMASGWPKPTLRWTKDGSKLPLTDRHFFTADDQLLIIMDTTMSDSGIYACEMTNSLGTNRGQAHLTILPVYESNVNDDDITGVIIITVVCCAVGTSIVWVIIIYQTRKRLNTPSPVVHLDNKSEHSSSSKDSGTGESTKRSHEDLLLETVNCVHQEGEQSPGPEVTLPLLTSFHPHTHPHTYGDTATAVYKVPCCCQPADRTNHDRHPGYLCVPVYLPTATSSSPTSQPV